MTLFIHTTLLNDMCVGIAHNKWLNGIKRRHVYILF